MNEISKWASSLWPNGAADKPSASTEPPASPAGIKQIPTGPALVNIGKRKEDIQKKLGLEHIKPFAGDSSFAETRDNAALGDALIFTSEHQANASIALSSTTEAANPTVEPSLKEVLPASYSGLTEAEQATLMTGGIIGKNSINSGFLMTNYVFSFYKMTDAAPEIPIAAILNTQNAKALLPNCHSLSLSEIEDKDIGRATSFNATYQFFRDPQQQDKLITIKLACKLEAAESKGYSLHFEKGAQSSSGDLKGEFQIIPWQGKSLVKAQGSLAVSNLFVLMITDHIKSQISQSFQQIFQEILSRASKTKPSEQSQTILSNVLSLHEN